MSCLGFPKCANLPSAKCLLKEVLLYVKAIKSAVYVYSQFCALNYI